MATETPAELRARAETMVTMILADNGATEWLHTLPERDRQIIRNLMLSALVEGQKDALQNVLQGGK